MNDKTELTELLQAIGAIKRKLNELISKKGVLAPEVIEVSQQLDKLLTEYYEIRKNGKEKPSPEEDDPEKD